MENISLNSKYANLMLKVKSFTESYYFMIILGLITFMTWVFKLTYLPYYIAVVALILIVLSKAQFISLANIYLLIIGGNQTNTLQYKAPFIILIILSAIPLVILIINLIKNFKTYFNKTKKDSIIISLLLLFIALAISIINSPVVGKSIIITSLFLVNILTSALVLCTVEITEENRNKMAFSFVIILYTLFLEASFKFIELLRDSNVNIWKAIYSKQIHLGWQISNHYMPIVCISFILAFFLYIKTNKLWIKIISFISLILGAVLTVVTLCRGSWMGLLISIPFLVFAYIKYKKNWKLELPFILSLVLMVIVVTSLFIHYEFWDKLKLYGYEFNLELNAREGLYQVAIDEFAKHWLIGSGYGSSFYYISLIGRSEFNYHNMFLQASQAGILGIITFSLYLLIILRRVIRKNDLFSFFVLIVFIYLLVHGMVDTIFFNRKIMPFFGMLVMLVPEKPLPDITVQEEL